MLALLLIFISGVFILCQYSLSLSYKLYDSQRNFELKTQKCEELNVCVPTDHALILENVWIGLWLHILCA